ncbi:thymidine kinase [Saxibacter everestensis]|uniref:Thymidine kinase n=1 Tax=Saxibacter everestensis TaxID=2909229 RepID=A0ABY8QP54_9MICO|nr:thymidine kinase [Brevibacteriaceae bacterium ZFBP1038]
MAQLVFFTGTMNCGKSTLALQMDYNHSSAGRHGLIFTRDDRAGDSVLSSRLGLTTTAIEVRDDTDFWDEVANRRTYSSPVHYLIVDEAQFYSAIQIEQLAGIVDEMGIDVFAFGFTTDFRSRLFAGAQRLIELADRVEVLQVEALCWCGARATHNARTEGGVMVTEGRQVVIGDIATPDDAAGDPGLNPPPPEVEVGYETLCRRHHMRRMTAARAKELAPEDQLLPIDTRVRPPSAPRWRR